MELPKAVHGLTTTELSSREKSHPGTVSVLPVWLFWSDDPRLLQRATVEGVSVSIDWQYDAMKGLLWMMLLNHCQAHIANLQFGPPTPCARHERR